MSSSYAPTVWYVPAINAQANQSLWTLVSWPTTDLLTVIIVSCR